MLDILSTLAAEFAKSFAGEAGKAGARALFSEEAEPEQLLYDPVADAEYTGTSFLHALALRDHDAAWTWCDPSWPNDPERNQSFHNTFSAAPPATWNVRQRYVPSDWQEGTDLLWVGLDVLVTFDLLDGTYSTIEGLLWIFPTEDGWRVADIIWDPDGHRRMGAEELEIEELVVACARCPEQFSIPAGGGRVRVRCPACWTMQEVDS